MQLTFAFVTVLSILPCFQQAETDSIRQRVEALVRDLDADRFAVRKAAKSALVELGPTALPFLKVPKNASVDLRLEVQEVRLKLRNQRAVRSLEPAKINLTGSFTVDQIADRIRQQTDNPLSVAQLPSSVRGRVLNVAFTNQPFWKAMLSLAKDLKCGVEVVDGKVRLVNGDSNRVSSINSAHLIQLAPIERKSLVGQAGKSLLRLPLSFATEPRLRALYLESSGARTEVVVDGRKLVGFSPDRTLELPIGGRGEAVTWRHDVLIEDKAIPKTIAVRGEIDVLMAAGYERFEFDNLPTARRQRQNRAGVVLVIDEVEIDDERGNLSVTITVNWKRSVAAFDSYRTWQFHNEVWLQTAAGNRIDFAGPLRTDAQAGGGVRLTYTFKGVVETLRDCTFMYEAPTALQTVKVPFQFDAVPTPEPR